MKAIQYERFGGSEALTYVDLPRPVPGDGEVPIATTAIGVSFPYIQVGRTSFSPRSHF